MKLYSTKHGIAREGEAGELALLDIKASDLGELLRSDPTLASLKSAPMRRTLVLADTELMAPVQAPGCIYCIGANYESHVEEMATLNIGNSEAIQATLKTVSYTHLRAHET